MPTHRTTIPRAVTGSCNVPVNESTLPGLSQVLKDNSMLKKLKDATAIFPVHHVRKLGKHIHRQTAERDRHSGERVFARDLYNPLTPNNQVIPGMETLPSGMVTLDADGGAFSPGGATYALAHVLPAEFSNPRHLYTKRNSARKVSRILTQQTLLTDPLWSGTKRHGDVGTGPAPIKPRAVTGATINVARYPCSTNTPEEQTGGGAPGTLSQDLFDYFKKLGRQRQSHGQGCCERGGELHNKLFFAAQSGQKKKALSPLCFTSISPASIVTRTEKEWGIISISSKPPPIHRSKSSSLP